MRTIARSRGKRAMSAAGDRVAHDHQPVDFGAIGGVELRQRLLGAADDAHLGAEDLLFKAEIRALAVFGVEHRDGHLRFLPSWVLWSPTRKDF